MGRFRDRLAAEKTQKNPELAPKPCHESFLSEWIMMLSMLANSYRKYCLGFHPDILDSYSSFEFKEGARLSLQPLAPFPGWDKKRGWTLWFLVARRSVALPRH
jgi:hypothetical protein